MDCWELFKRLPPELQIRIIAFLPRTTYEGLLETSPISQTLNLLNRAHARTIRATHIRLCYGFESRILSLVSVLFLPSYRAEWFHSRQHISDAERMQCTVLIATEAMQRAIPSLRQTALIEHHASLLYGLLYFGGNLDVGHRDVFQYDLFWFIFCKYDQEERIGILNFVENLWGAWYQENQIVHFESRLLCQHQQFGPPCCWRLRRRLLDEFEELGILEYVVKQFLLRQLTKLFKSFFWLPPTEGDEYVTRRLDRGLASFQNISWSITAHICSVVTGPGPGPYGFRVQLQFMEDTYDISVFGDRGNGVIKLELAPGLDILRWLDMAAGAPPGTMPDWSHLAEDETRSTSRVVYRVPYWDKLWIGEANLGLERLFEC